jgi:predicted amidophosphoribosyltransferase
VPLLKRPTDPTRCPNCGERATPYAVVCWLCGAVLDPRRWQRPPGVSQRVRALWRAAFGRAT